MGIIKWLQLSDLHFGHDSEYTRNCRNQLLEYLKTKNHDIDYMFITGDIVYAKELKNRESAYKEAAEYLKCMAKILWKNSDVDTLNDRIFAVPGNHDVIRNSMRESVIESILEKYPNDDSGKIETSLLGNCTESLKDYYAFMQYIKGKDTYLANKHHYVVSTERINIVHLNTCISSGKNDEKGKLILGYELLSKALNTINNDLPTIALAHHSLECLEESEQKKVEILLKERGIGLYLCGHSHERESNIILRYNQNVFLNSFTAGTLMAGDSGASQDTVIFKGELDTKTRIGKIYSYKWTFVDHWRKDMDFGLAQGGRQDNFRQFKYGNLWDISSIMSFEDDVDTGGVYSKIVSHTATERENKFNAVNERAKTSLSVYGIGITHVSKKKELLERILSNKGSVRLCMMDPRVLKNDVCRSLIEDKKGKSCISIKVDGCDIDNLRFCIDASHMDKYIREEYAKDVQESYDRLLKLKKEFIGKNCNIKLRILKSFVPISLNIVNEDKDDAELIAEYNMPFVTKRLLIHLNKDKNPNYYNEMKNVFEKIWEQAEEVQDENRP